METFTFTMAQEGVFEAPNNFVFEDESINNSWMDIELDSNSSSMSLFEELEEIQEVDEERMVTNNVLLSELISQCGIPAEEEITTCPASPTNSTSSEDSDMEAHQSLIEELECFFGSPTSVPEEEEDSGLVLVTKTSVVAPSSPTSILKALASGRVFNAEYDVELTEESLRDAVTTSCITEDGQNVIIIIAPPSPAGSTTTSYDTDPEWIPSPNSSPLRTLSDTSTTIKRKYQRSKPPSPPSGPYPVEKKERKKAQNRTAAFRYREKKKGELDVVETEMDILKAKNVGLRQQLSEMETEAKLLKKLMTEAGLGRYAASIKL
jgi:hypothetical protein